jgi:hypothetical protein
MGDMADYHIDSMFDDDWQEYEAFGITCKYCGHGPLWWAQHSDGDPWRLYDENGRVHKCKEYRKGE